MTATATRFAMKVSSWSVETTTTMGDCRPLPANGGRSVEPAPRDEARLSAVRLAGYPQFLWWSRVPEIQPNTRVTSLYVLTVEIEEGLITRAGDSAAFAPASASVAIVPGALYAGSWKPRIPRTALGKRLLESRRRIVASGVPLLDWAGIEQEVRARRGERDC